MLLILIRENVYRLDLDVESGTPTGYETFVNRIRSHASGTKKKK